MLISKSETTNKFGATVTKAHVKYNGNYYIVSDNSKEVIIFSSDKDGGCKFVQVGDGMGDSLDEVVSNVGSYIFHNMGFAGSWMDK
tara:strand:+ start:46 stop:303 length:258 start_codon:yes stop_codon:yes gene_type:complete